MRDRPTLVLLGYIKIVVCFGFGNSCVNGFHCHMSYCRVRQGLCFGPVDGTHLFVRVSEDCSFGKRPGVREIPGSGNI